MLNFDDFLQIGLFATDFFDPSQVTIARSLLFPLHGDSRRTLRLGVLARVENLIKNTPDESRKVLFHTL